VIHYRGPDYQSGRAGLKNRPTMIGALISPRLLSGLFYGITSEDNMALRSLPLALFSLWIVASVHAQEKSKPTYDALLEQVKKSDPKADFLKLRMAFTQTANYNPYDDDRKTQDEMTKALDKKEYNKAIELANKVLKEKYVDLKAHSVAERAYKALGKEGQAKFHRTVFDGLIQSILKSGDGKTTATAYVVIATEEEYVVLGELGIRRTRQALMEEKGQKFDRMDGIDQKSKERVTVYFNVTKPLGWLREQLEKGK
jgi:hypothetical protein